MDALLFGAAMEVGEDQPTPSDIVQMLDTLDPLQKQHRCSLMEISVWRTILAQRYLSLQNSEIDQSISNFSSNNTLVPLPASHDAISAVDTPLPPHVAKTIFRLATTTPMRPNL